MASEHLRRIRRRYEAQGEAGIPRRGPGGSKPKADAKTRERLFRRFEEGMSASAVKRAEPRLKLSYSTVLRPRHAWEKSRPGASPAITPPGRRRREARRATGAASAASAGKI